MDKILEILSYPFVARAMCAGILVALCAAMLGVILVLKRYSMIGHGLADVGFAAMSLSLALSLPAMYISMPVVIIAAFFIMLISQKSGTGGDAAVGMVATAALSAGVIITALSKGFNIDVYNYMFGSILAMSGTDVVISAVLAVIVIGLFILFYNRLFLITFDESYAKACGVNVTFYQFMIAFLTAVTVVIGMRIIGTLLISSLIIFPAMTAKRLVSSFKGTIIAAALTSVICFICGMFISFAFNLPTGASVVGANVVVLLIVLLFGRNTRAVR